MGGEVVGDRRRERKEHVDNKMSHRNSETVPHQKHHIPVLKASDKSHLYHSANFTS